MDSEDLLAANGGGSAPVTVPGDVDGLADDASTAGTSPGPSDPVAATDTTRPGERAPAPAVTSPPVTRPTGPSAGTGCATGDTSPIRIGSVGNYSGPAGSSLLPIAKALRVWAEWTNLRGGLCGRKIEVIVVDDHSDPAQHRTALQDLVENRGVIAFVNADALTGAGGVEYLERVKVPQIAFGCDDGPQANSPMFFLACSGTFILAFGSARNVTLYGPGSRQVALITCREVEVCGARPRRSLIDQGAAKEAGIEIVYEAQASITQPDYTAECRGAQVSGAESVLLFMDAGSVRRFGQSCARQGYNPVYSQVTATVTYGTKDLLGLSNLLVTLDLFPFTAGVTPAQQEFQEAMQQLYGQQPGPGETYGWVGGKMFELAATNAARESGSINAATVVAAFQKMKNETFGGLTVPVSFSPGKPGIYPPCWFPIKASGGQWIILNDGKPVCR